VAGAYLSLAATLLWLGMDPVVVADTRLIFNETSKAGTRPLTMLVKDHRVAFLAGGEGSQALLAWYDRNDRAFVFVNHPDRQYTVISRAWAKEMRRRVDETSRRLTEDIKRQAAAMPPDLRPYYQQTQVFSPWMTMFAQGASAPGAGQPRQYVAGSRTRKLAGRECQQGEIRQAGKKTMELCVANYGVPGISDEDAATLREMRSDCFELYKLGAFLFGFTPPGPAKVSPEAPGIALEFRDIAGDGPLTALTAVQAEAVDPKVFELPPEYLQAVIPLPGPLD
jgi:hypothetical protein